MKKSFLITMLFAMISTLAGAQANNEPFGIIPIGSSTNEGDYDFICMIPSALTKDGNAVIYTVNIDTGKFTIFDDNFQVTKQFTISLSDRYSLAYTLFYSDISGIVDDGGTCSMTGWIFLVKDIFGSGYNYLLWDEVSEEFVVFNSDNQKITSIDAPSGYEIIGDDITYLKLGKNVYLVLDMYNKQNDYYYTAFYRINDTGNSVSLVSMAPSARISPRVPRKGEKVTVTVGSEMQERNCQVQVVSASGQTVMNSEIPAGQSQLDINTSRLSKGVYVVTVSSEGVSKEAAKIIIR